jgi:hypothetical protein
MTIATVCLVQACHIGQFLIFCQLFVNFLSTLASLYNVDAKSGLDLMIIFYYTCVAYVELLLYIVTMTKNYMQDH